MVADKGKKSKVEEEASDPIDGELVLSIEKLQEIQDEIEKVMGSVISFFPLIFFIVKHQIATRCCILDCLVVGIILVQ